MSRLLASILAAQIGAPEIEWDAPAACPAAGAVEQRLAELRGDAAPTLPSDARVRARVRRVGAGWEMSLEIVGPRGTEHRTLEADDCRDLADAAALIAAAAFDPSGASEATEDAPSSRAAPAPTSAREPSAIEPPENARIEPRAPGDATDHAPPARAVPTPRVPRRIGVRVLARAGAGRLAGGDLGVLAGAGIGWPRIRLDAWASAFAPALALHPDRDAEAVMTLVTLGLRAGPHWSWGRFSVAAHGALEAGPVRLRGRGTGIDRARDGWSAWVGLGPQVAVQWRATAWLSLVVEAEVFGAAVRPQARVRGEPSFWSSAPVAGGGAIGVALGPFDGPGRQSGPKRRR